MEIAVESAPPIAHTLALRLPEWCSAPQASVNGEHVNCEPRKGYLQTSHLAGKVAILRGPIIYCLEETDNGTELHNVWLNAESRFSLIEGTGLFSSKILLQAGGVRLQHTHSEEAALYQYDKVPGQLEPQQLTFIPWFSWANRGEGEMRIWVNER